MTTKWTIGSIVSWVLIPYDGNSILRLWDKSVRNRTSKTGSALATSFLDKTFQLRFKAPPLLLLDWREFLQKTLQKALPRHDEADFRDVYRAYAAKGGFEATVPTPRDLKIFCQPNWISSQSTSR